MKRIIFLSTLALLLACVQSFAQQKFVKEWIEGAWASSNGQTLLIVKKTNAEGGEYYIGHFHYPEGEYLIYFNIPENSVSGSYLADDGEYDAGEIEAKTNGTFSWGEDTFVKNTQLLPELQRKYNSFVNKAEDDLEKTKQETIQFCKENGWIDGEWKGTNYTYLVDTSYGNLDGKFVVVSLDESSFTISFVEAHKMENGKYNITFISSSEDVIYVDTNNKTLSSDFAQKLTKTSKRCR